MASAREKYIGKTDKVRPGTKIQHLLQKAAIRMSNQAFSMRAARAKIESRLERTAIQ